MTKEEFEKLVANCQPHKYFKLDWIAYSPKDFANTFLPNVSQIKRKEYFLVDGAELFIKNEKIEGQTLLINKNKVLLEPIFYSFPNGVLAGDKKETINIDKLAVCCFITVFEDDDIEISFRFGEEFRKILVSYLAEKKLEKTVYSIENNCYHFTISEIINYFNNSISHYSLLSFIGKIIEINLIEVSLNVQMKVHFLETHDIYFSPMGIFNPLNKDEVSSQFKFSFEIVNQPAKKYWLKILREDKILHYSTFTPQVPIKSNDSRNQSDNSGYLEARPFYEPGIYTVFWDGFNNDGKFDSLWFNDTLVLQIEVFDEDSNSIQISKQINYSRAIKNVDWIDLKIDRNNKSIDILLRLNLTDGGSQGVGECKEIILGSDGMILSCPWDDVPQEELKRIGKPIIMKRNRTFQELVHLAIAGFKKHWSRNESNIGKGVFINGECFSVNVDAVLESNSSKALNSVPLVFNTNKSWERSGNTGGSYRDDSMLDNLFENIPDGIIQRIAYNVGYVFNYFGDDKWTFVEAQYEDLEFMFTAAHEIGHELLQAFGGTIYSWQHKGSSFFIPQEVKPIDLREYPKLKVDYLPKIKGEFCPKNKEIDLMKYYLKGPYHSDLKNVVASQEDVLGLIWLFKMKISNR